MKSKNLPSSLAGSYDEAREIAVRGLDTNRYTGHAKYFGSDQRGDLFITGVAPNGMVPRFDMWVIVGTDGNARFVPESEHVFGWVATPIEEIKCMNDDLYIQVLEALADWWTNPAPRMSFLPIPKKVRSSWIDRQVEIAERGAYGRI